MSDGEVHEEQPQVYDAKKLEPAKKRKRSESPSKNGNARASSRRDADKDGESSQANDELPVPYDAKALEPAKKRARSSSPGPSGDGGDGPRRPKRPGQRARITEAEREAIRQRALERERLAQQRLAEEQRHRINDVVKAHYNAVPERGRDWRKTDSRIKGLRSFNNWVKSCIIQKFSPDEDYAPGPRESRGDYSADQAELLVLDIGCGKGGDLGKWQQAPQTVALYVGLDPADVSIDQARERYRSMVNRGGGGRGGRGGFRGGGGRPPPRVFDGRFHVKDCYGESIEDVDIVRQVGFDSSVHGRGRGFDVVSMMFCMHYAFESEQKARRMLKNVAGALKKGGRFIGCIPNSDVIGSRVEEYHARMASMRKKHAEATEKNKKAVVDATSDGAAAAAASDAAATTVEGGEGEDSNKKKEPKDAFSANGAAVEEGELEEGETEGTAEWGNDIYRVRFPGKTPEDGVFRPPFGWKYNFFLHEAVEEVPEYVVPWEAFRALAEDFNLELQYHKSFRDVWDAEKDDWILGPLSERMGVRDRRTGDLLVSEEEMEAAAFYVAFCFYKV